MKKTKKLALNKNTTKQIKVRTDIQTGVPASSEDPGYTYSCGGRSIIK